MGAVEKHSVKSGRERSSRRHSIQDSSTVDPSTSAPTLNATIAVEQKTALSPATAAGKHKPKTQRRLLRKSSSTSLLDVDAAPADAPAAHKLQRKSSSLGDLTAEGKEVASALKEKKHDTEKKKEKATKKAKKSARLSGSRIDSQTALPPLTPKTGRDGLPAQPQDQTTEHHPPIHPNRRKRAGDIHLQRQPTIKVVVKYEVGQAELKKFKLCFSQIDLDQSGSIDYDEFFEFIDERKTPFSEGLFRLIDADSNGTIDYEEFVHATVMYCMYTRDEILQFAFDTFDPGKTGGIGEKEFKRLISLVNDGKPAFPGNFKSALAEFDRNKDGVIDFDEFKILNKRYPMLLFPCFRLQDRMQKSTLGEKHWHKLHKRLYNRLKLENYQRKHNGALPPLGVVSTIRKFLGLDGSDRYMV